MKKIFFLFLIFSFSIKGIPKLKSTLSPQGIKSKEISPDESILKKYIKIYLFYIKNKISYPDELSEKYILEKKEKKENFLKELQRIIKNYLVLAFYAKRINSLSELNLCCMEKPLDLESEKAITKYIIFIIKCIFYNDLDQSIYSLEDLQSLLKKLSN